MDLGRVVASVCELVWLWPTDIHRHLRWPIFEIAAMQIHFFSVLTRLQIHLNHYYVSISIYVC